MNPETFKVMLKFFERVVGNEEEYDCKHCLEPFADIEKLKIHSITKHLERRFVCDFCLNEYKHESTLLKHIDMMHMKLDQRYLRKKNIKKVVKKKPEDEEKDDYKPESESETEDSDYDKYDDEGKRVKKPGVQYPRKCDHCDYEVPVRKKHYHHYLIMHKDIIDQYPFALTDNEKLPCSYCGMLMRVGARLRDHEAKHSGIKVKCTHCDKMFANTTNMTQHIYSVHTERKYICDYCTKGYKTRGDFQRHIWIHTGDKPFKCHICSAGFAHSGNRQIHIRSAHQNIKQVPKKKQVIKEKKDKSSKIKKTKNSQTKQNKKQKRSKKLKSDSESDSDSEALSKIFLCK